MSDPTTILSPRLTLVPPPVERSRRGHGNKGVWKSLLVFVVLPLFGVAFYLFVMAADQFASRIGFSVRAEGPAAAVEILGGR